jgi:hypothetical protein
MSFFIFGLAVYIVGIPFGLFKPSVNDEEFVVYRKRR